MKAQILSLVIASLLASTASAQSVKDRIDKWLAPIDNPVVVSEPKPARPIPSTIARPQPGLVNVDVLPPLSPLPAIKPYRPRNAFEPSPLLGWTGDREPPAEMKVPPATLFVQPDPVPEIMGIFGQYVRDRVSLADPSWEASMSLILDPKMPWRDATLPFQAYNLPDPFESANTIRLRTPLPEAAELPRFGVPPTGR
ncbi:MAG: hypothetical protein WCL32_00845 [Planctomycetota bacterium]